MIIINETKILSYINRGNTSLRATLVDDEIKKWDLPFNYELVRNNVNDTWKITVYLYDPKHRKYDERYSNALFKHISKEYKSIKKCINYAEMGFNKYLEKLNVDEEFLAFDQFQFLVKLQPPKVGKEEKNKIQRVDNSQTGLEEFL